MVKDSNKPDILGKFIERFGTTIHGALARERPAAIAQDAPASAKPDGFAGHSISGAAGSAGQSASSLDDRTICGTTDGA